MKWLGVLKIFTHPSLLPLAISTFVTIAGPGGVAEISRHAPAIANVPTIDTLLVVAPPSEPMVLVLRPVPSEKQSDAAVPIKPVAPFVDSQLPGDQPHPEPEISLNSDGGPTPPESPGPAPIVPSGPPTDPSDELVPPPTASPDSDTGEPDSDGNGNDDGSEAEPVCDPPGTGPEPHEGVPPGHDQNADGVDDRCQGGNADVDGAGDDGSTDGSDDDAADDTGADTANDNDNTGDDTGNDDGDTGDAGDTGNDEDNSDDTGGADDSGNQDGTDDDGDGDEPVCDPPGNGPEPHGGVPPGHDKNEDGIDDRCQEGDESAGQDGCHSNGNGDGNGNGHDQDGDGVDDHCGDNGEDGPTGNDGKDDHKDKNKKEDDS